MFGHKKGLEKKLLENGGNVAWATVLEGRKTWSSASGSGYYSPSNITKHMRLELRVEPESEPPFEAALQRERGGVDR